MFANYEMPLSTRGHPIEKLANIRADPAIAPDIGRLGLTVAGLANNHMMDYGAESLADTISNLTDQGIKLVGAGETLAQAAEPMIVTHGDRMIGFLAFCCLVAPGAGATAVSPGVAPIHVHSSYQTNPYWQAEEPGEPAMVTIRTFADPAEQAFAEECVRALRKEVDFLCLSLHWGYGGLSSKIAEYQRPLGQAMIDAGADIIFGNHVHAVQGVEQYKGKVIIYSPGTFVGRQLPPESEGAEITDLVRSLLDDMSPDGFLSFVDVDESGGYELRDDPDHARCPRLARDRLGRGAGSTSATGSSTGRPSSTLKVQLVGGELRVGVTSCPAQRTTGVPRAPDSAAASREPDRFDAVIRRHALRFRLPRDAGSQVRELVRGALPCSSRERTARASCRATHGHAKATG